MVKSGDFKSPIALYPIGSRGFESRLGLNYQGRTREKNWQRSPHRDESLARWFESSLPWILYLLYYTMEKLIELLNEYQTQRESKFKFSGYDERSMSFLLVDSDEVLWEETIISKKFWFIERLIANDKLNKERLFNIIRESCIFDDINICSESDYIIMYLAIGYNPIYFLTSMVK